MDPGSCVREIKRRLGSDLPTGLLPVHGDDPAMTCIADEVPTMVNGDGHGVDVLLGADIGTTDSKVLVTTIDGTEVLSVAAPSPWTDHDGRYTDMPAERLVRTVLDLLEQAAGQAAERLGGIRVRGIGVTGMGEAGVLLDEHGRPLFPVLAWFDPRGGAEIRRFPAALLAEFCGRTGLPVSPMATIGKLAWMRGQGIDFAGKTWLNVAEYLVYRLGGVAVTEMSLLARTGLLDQDTGKPWPAALAAIGATTDLVPPMVLAGTPLGRASNLHGAVPIVLHGAVLTVAGHDHPVAAVACGGVGAGDLFDSFGTAEALVQTVPGDLDFAARERLARNGIDAGLHVLGGRRALIGGTKAGLLLRRTLRMLGADNDEGRRRIDDAVLALPGGPEGVEITGAANSDGVLRIAAMSEDISPALLFKAVLDHAIGEAARCLEHMSREIGPPSAAVVAGGWTKMHSIRAAKMASLPAVRFSERSQAGAFGAALFASYALIEAQSMAAAGDDSAIADEHPSGPSPEFAAAFGGSPIRSTPSRRREQRQETYR